jgi:hypothetical protein
MLPAALGLGDKVLVCCPSPVIQDRHGRFLLNRPRAANGDDGLVFTSPTGEPLRHSNFRRRVWLKHWRRPGSPISTFTI